MAKQDRNLIVIIIRGLVIKEHKRKDKKKRRLTKKRENLYSQEYRKTNPNDHSRRHVWRPSTNHESPCRELNRIPNP